jgi:hypothetical protein
MSDPLINILIRTHPGRTELLSRALNSVYEQSYNKTQIEIYYDASKSKEPYHYNLFCNELKSRVKSGYFFFLDSDDYLNTPDVLERIVPHLRPDRALIVQMLRNGRPKPFNNAIRRGYIGMPCMVLHYSHQDLADVTAKAEGDYEWIKSVTDQIGYKFVPIVLVNAGKRSHGK